MSAVKTKATGNGTPASIKDINTKVDKQAPYDHKNPEALTINEAHLQELLQQQSLLGEKQKNGIERAGRTLTQEMGNDYFARQRKENVISFKRNISDHITEMEVNHARINIEEKLQNCGHIGYITEAQAAQLGQVNQQKNVGMDILDMLTLVSLGVILGVSVCMYRQSFYM